eukprot:GHVR01135917.1.p1 GENE.GHVR01135917.1~~GHVR01135917.1.p1  ORF type:complete len:219 (+),score=7.29 GHVR01135917.1:77-733(+)
MGLLKLTMMMVVMVIGICALNAYDDSSIEETRRELYGRLERKLENLHERVRHLENRNETTRKTRSLSLAQPIGAFSARTTSSFYLGSVSVIKWNYVTLNNQNAYNRNTGVYTCPITGTYIFYLNAASLQGYYPFRLAIYNGGSAFAYMFTGYYSNMAQSSATTAIVQCTKGTHITVRVIWRASSSCYMEGNMASFSGYLLDVEPVRASSITNIISTVG